MVWLMPLYFVITIFAGAVFLITSFMTPDSVNIAIIINLLAFVFSKYHV